MDRSSLSKSVNGGYIERYEVDLLRNAVVLRVDVLDEDTLTSYDLRFERLSHFSVDSESVGDKERLELTELWIDSAPESSSSEEWSVIVSIWDITHLRIRCSVIRVDGEPLR